MTPVHRNEDWWAVGIGWILLAAAFGGLVTAVPNLPRWSALGSSLPLDLAPSLIFLLVVLGVLTGTAVFGVSGNVFPYLRAFPAVFLLAVVAFVIGSNQVLASYGLGYALWALVVGLVVSNGFGTPSWLRPAVRTELFIKTGLVILGAEIVFGRIVTLGQYGLIVAWGVTPVVLIAMYRFGRRLGLEPSFSVVVAAATSVCGVSAAIAAAGACRARKDELTLAVGMTLIFTVLMMIGMPALCQALGLDPVIAGAWIGGTLDSTGAVAAAGEFLGPEALEVAAVIKMIQNLLIGVIAFAIAILWVTQTEDGGPRVRVAEVWTRFPKFVLGFVGASFVVSVALVPILGDGGVDAATGVTSDLRSWFFCLAFLSIGLESEFSRLADQMARGRPLILYVVGQAFNVVLTLVVVWLVFGGVLFDVNLNAG